MNTNLRKLKLTIILMCALALSANAQFQYRFLPLQIKQGLSSNKVNDIFRDSRGYVWITTENGLNRYDGHRFRTYYTSFDQKNLYTNHTWGVHEDGNGVLWIGLKEAECTLYFPEEDRFDKDTYRYLKRLGLTADISHTTIDLDDQRNLWIYGGKSVEHYNFHLKKWRHYNIPDVINVYVENRSAFLVQKDLTIKIIPFNGKSVKTDTSLKEEVKEPHNGIPNLFVDRQGGIWAFSNKHDKLLYKEKGAKQWHRFQSNVDCPTIDIYDMDEDMEGTILFAMGHQSLCYYDRQSKTILQVDAANSHILPGIVNSVRHFEHTVWICYDRQGVGVSFTPIKGMEMQFLNIKGFDDLRFTDCSAIARDADHNTWYGTNNEGISVLDNDGNLIRHFDLEGRLNSVISLFCDKKGRMWASGQSDGIYIFDKAKATPMHIRNGEDYLWGESITCFGTDKQGNVWAASKNGGMQRWNETTHTFDYPILMDQHISDIQFLPNGEFVVATSDGYYFVNTKNGKIKRSDKEDKALKKYGIVDHDLHCMMCDSRNWLWKGGNSGIVITDLNSDHIVHIGGEEGLCNLVIHGIAEDKQHNMWIATENGLCRIIVPKSVSYPDSHHLKVQNFSIYDGLKSNFCNTNALLCINDYMVVGSPGGISFIKTDDVPEMRKRSRVYITELCIGIDSVCASVDTTLTYRIPNDDPSFKVRFSLLNEDEAKDFVYAYRLSSKDNWEYTRNTELSFKHLAPGHYTIELCMSAETDEDTGLITHLNVYVCYPWYRTWWAITLFILSGACLLFIMRKQHKRFTTMRDRLAEMQRGFMLAVEKRENVRLRSEIKTTEVEVTDADQVLQKRAIEIIEKNIDNSDFTVEQLSQELGMSRANLHRKLVALVGQGPLGFIRTVRLDHAKQLLLKSQMTIAEISYAVGFNNPKNFSRYFKEEYGDTPSQYREKANAE